MICPGGPGGATETQLPVVFRSLLWGSAQRWRDAPPVQGLAPLAIGDRPSGAKDRSCLNGLARGFRRANRSSDTGLRRPRISLPRERGEPHVMGRAGTAG